MPRVRSPASSAIVQKPREFALLQQLAPKADGTVDQKALDNLLAQYGQAKDKGAVAAEMSFEEFAALFAAPATETKDGEGNTVGWAAFDATSPLRPWRFNRRATGAKDVRLQITHAGICHSDIHMARGDWGPANYPLVTGHEIVGFVTEVGPGVTKFKVGDRVGVGCLVNSCKSCTWCVDKKEEQYCEKGMVVTYGGTDVDGTPTQGGYSTAVVVDEGFVLHVPDNLPLASSAPLLCAGITTYSPIKKFGFDKAGMRIGVVGLGGLGHMAVQFLKAFGCEVTVVSTSPGKKEEAMKVLKADHFIVSKDPEQMKAAAATLDGIINTVSAAHDMGPLLSLLKTDTTMVYVGAPALPPTLPTMSMLLRRLRVAGSLIGGLKETQEMLDFCGKHNITCLSEIIPASNINEAYDRTLKSDVRYRFVIDVQGSIINA